MDVLSCVWCGCTYGDVMCAESGAWPKCACMCVYVSDLMSLNMILKRLLLKINNLKTMRSKVVFIQAGSMSPPPPGERASDEQHTPHQIGLTGIDELKS